MDEAPSQWKEDDFDALYRGHVGDVYRYSLSLVRNPVDAEDVTQTTFLNAFAAYSDHPPRKPRPWLIAIARNVCHERHRQSLRRPQQVTLVEVAATPADDFSVRAEEIFSALQGIPSRQRIALLLDGLEGRSRGEIAEKLGVVETTVSGLLTRGRNNLRLQLDEGMTCERAQWAMPRLWSNGIPRTERRAAIAHLRNCEQCAAAGKPARSLSYLLGTLWLSLRRLTEPVVRLVPGTSRLGEAAAGAGGGVFVAKTVILATVGTLAGGVAWHEASQFHARQRPVSGSSAAVAHPVAMAAVQPASWPSPPAAAPLASRPGQPAESTAVTRDETPAPSPFGGLATGSPSLVHEGPTTDNPALPTPADSQLPSVGAEERSLAVTSGSATYAAPSAASSTGPHPTNPSADGDSGSGQGNSGQGTPGGQATAPGQLKKSDGVSGSQSSAPSLHKTAGKPSGRDGAPGQQRKVDGGTVGHANAPGQEKKTAGNAAAGRPANGDAHGNLGVGRANAPGQQGTPGEGNSDGNQTTAPGQQGNPGQGNSVGNQAAAPGQQGNPGQGNSVGNQAAAPGQQGNSGQGNSVGNQAAAPGQQGNSGQGNSDGNQAAAPGQQGNSGQGNSDGNQAAAPGQQGNSGQGNSVGNQAAAPGQQGNPGQGNSVGNQAAAPGQQGNPGQGNSSGRGNAGS